MACVHLAYGYVVKLAFTQLVSTRTLEKSHVLKMCGIGLKKMFSVVGCFFIIAVDKISAGFWRCPLSKLRTAFLTQSIIVFSLSLFSPNRATFSAALV